MRRLPSTIVGIASSDGLSLSRSVLSLLRGGVCVYDETQDSVIEGYGIDLHSTSPSTFLRFVGGHLDPPSHRHLPKELPLGTDRS